MKKKSNTRGCKASLTNHCDSPTKRRTKALALLCLSSILVVGTTSASSDSYSNKTFSVPSSCSVVQENGTIKGCVRSSNGDPLPGVSVKVEGTSLGTATDVSGNYTLKNVPKNSKVTFSFIGFKTSQLTITKFGTINATLEETTQNVEEFVMVGYGSQKKANLSGAVTQVSSKKLENRSIANIGQGLQGLIPNLNISVSSGQANTSPSFNIRGTNSLNGGSPIIIVDNIPMSSSDLAAMNPNDIESISVLKDAASAAIYGGRASYGVILVKTKKGTSDKVKVSVNSFYTLKSIGRIPKVVTDPYTVACFKDVMAQGWYDLYSEEALLYAKGVSEGKNPISRINPLKPAEYEYFGSTNWFNEVYEDYSPSSSTNFSISQNTDKINYYLSGEYYNQDGMFKYGNDKYNRYNLRSKVEFKLTDWLRFNTNIAYNTIRYDQPVWGGESYYHSLNRTSSLDIPKNADGSWTSSGASMIGRLQDGGRNVGYTNSINTSLGFDLMLIKDVLNIRGDANFVRSGYDEDEWDKPIFYSYGPNSSNKTGAQNSYAYQYNSHSRYNVFNVVADFHKTLNKHYLQVLAGFSQEESYWNGWNASRDQLISTSLPSMNLATGEKQVGTSKSSWALRGGFCRLNYIFNNKYIFESNVRYDGTSRFPKSDRFGFYPSFSGAWVASKESFFQSFNESILNNTISLLKFKASYGTLGNQSVSDYEYIPTMGSGKSSWIIGGKQPTVVSNPGLVSASLTWEKVIQKNLGVDLEMLNNRLVQGFDIYSRQTKDMLTNGQTLPSVLGTNVPKENAADLETKGWEYSIEWRDCFKLANKPFHYSARFVISDSHAKITRFSNPTNSLGDYYVGRKIGEIWGFKSDGFFKDADDVAKNAEKQKHIAHEVNVHPICPGDIKFKDLNNDGKIDRGESTLEKHGDLSIIGNSATRYPYSFDFSADWNGFDCRFFLQGVGKKDYWPNSGNHYFWGIYCQPWANLLESNLNHWTPENPNGYFPRPKSYAAEVDGVELAATNDRYLQDASYCRLKNITLGYTLPASLTQKAHISKCRIYVSGDNLWEMTNLDENLDPEGLTGKIYPFQRIYSFGINLCF